MTPSTPSSIRTPTHHILLRGTQMCWSILKSKPVATVKPMTLGIRILSTLRTLCKHRIMEFSRENTIIRMLETHRRSDTPASITTPAIHLQLRPLIRVFHMMQRHSRLIRAMIFPFLFPEAQGMGHQASKARRSLHKPCRLTQMLLDSSHLKQIVKYVKGANCSPELI